MSQQTRSTEERLVSLLLTLRNTTTGLSAEELVASVPGYASGDPATNPLSARRKFERDKDTLRELGIEVTTTGRPDEPRYRIDEDDYTLPALHLSAEQAACLNLAASAWRDGDLPATARRALTKLRAVSEGPAGSSAADLPTLTADLSGDEIPEALVAAVDERRLVTFDYVSARSGSTRARTVEPHHLRLSEGAWYLDAAEPRTADDAEEAWDGEDAKDATEDTGDPQDARGTSVTLLTFRLARIAGPVTVHSRPGAFTRLPAGTPSRRRALLAAFPGRALGLRLAGAHLDPAQEPHAELPAHLEGRDLIAVDYEDPFSFAGTIAALGDAVVVLGPEPLRQAVLAHLRGAAALAAPEEK
ncbi:WYL domain-containing protein [Actinomyces viscosus]|uniref:Proteasome accessory factor B n=1 Tax=Actinomyces viscosus TaxID=1656 RepID=A0A448PIW8_ACTVI|nr:WYL domain-containing protein [Actinomyces viscosus]TFH53944.1 WYL domain-containing protein [Actinomyces viscosus]VEI14911.1 Proteasome accessory factor B [Actinomyces viscosus]